LECCGYGANGMETEGYDCLFVNGAEAKADGARVNENICGRNNGLITADGATAASVCCECYVADQASLYI